MTAWLEELDDDEREEFIDALFDLLDLLQKEDMHTIDDLLKELHEDRGKIKCNVDKLSERQQQIIRDAKFKFVWNAVAAYTPSMFNDIKGSFMNAFSGVKRAFGDESDEVKEEKKKKNDPDWEFLNSIDDD